MTKPQEPLCPRGGGGTLTLVVRPLKKINYVCLPLAVRPNIKTLFLAAFKGDINYGNTFLLCTAPIGYFFMKACGTLTF